MAQQYNFKNYSVKEGVAQSQVYSLLQDSRGYLWMGTRGGGITRFDGINFKTFTTKDGLNNNYILCIKEDATHNLWIGTNNGLIIYNGIQFNNIFPDKTTTVEITDIDFDTKNNAWLATNIGVLKYDGKTFTPISKLVNDKQKAINTICCLPNDTVLYANANALFTLTSNNNNYSLLTDKSCTQINCIRKDKDNNCWIGTYGKGVYIRNKQGVNKLTLNAIVDNSIVWNINFDTKNNAWISTLSNGIFEYNLNTKLLTNLTEQEGLSNNHVRCMLQDNSGNFWFGTSGGGVSNYFGKLFTHYDKANGLGGNFVYSIFKDSKQKTWIGTANKGLTILDSTVFTTLNTSNGFADVKVKAINEDNFGTIYLGTDGNGLYIFKNNLFEPIEKLANQYIKSIIKDNDGNMWVASAGNGLYKIVPSTYSKGNNLLISNFNETSGLFSNRITCLFCDKKNRIWYGTEHDGMGCVGTDIHLQSTTGLPSNEIRCLISDAKDNLWIGTAGNGIASFNLYDTTLKISTVDNNLLTSKNIYLMCFERSNQLLLGTETGIDKLELTKFNQISAVKHYSKGDGFVGIETCQNAVCDNKDGTFWFGTINGLTKYNPANLLKNEHETITTITDVRLFYKPLAETKFKKMVGEWNRVKLLNLPYNQNHLSFDFIGINFSNPDAVKYKWILEGFDENWSPPTSQRTVTYSNIPNGQYIFKVISCNEDGVWNKNPTQISILIQKPFWKMWWFIAFAILLFVGGIWYIFRQREKNIKQKSLAIQQQLMLEKELIELEHKALRLQMNPHFIFNALNSIQSQIGTGNEQNARYYLAKFAKLMRQILDNSRTTTITLQDEIEMLENYLLVEKFCNNNSFNYSIQMQEGLETDYIKIPPMLLQPFVENAIKHGMKYLKDKTGEITIEILQENENLVCKITDNGIGRKKSAELNSLSKDIHHKSVAIEITKERLQLQNTNLNPVEIIDLYNEKNEAIGTKVVLKIPIN